MFEKEQNNETIFEKGPKYEKNSFMTDNKNHEEDYDEIRQLSIEKLNLAEFEEYFRRKFNIRDDFIASHLYVAPLMRISVTPEDLINCWNEEYIYSENSIMIFFPNHGIRINSTTSFATSISVIKNMTENKWKDKMVQLSYYDKNAEKSYKGPWIYISTSPLEMFLYENESLYDCTSLGASIKAILHKNNNW